MKSHVVAGIFARGGSKGVSRKNVRPICGKPLIAYSIEASQSSKLIDRVIVSTDDPEIAEIARKYGAEVPFQRPPELARDESPEWLAWQHAIRALDGQPGQPRWDAFVSVPTTSPLRKVEDIDACISKLLTGSADIVITVRAAERSPYFNMVTLDEHGVARLVIPPHRETSRRQDAPEVFDITTVAYAARPSFVLSATGIFQGKVEAIVVPTERALDIDTEHDFRVAECLLQQSLTAS
jgi:N,N'-diacetyl-8-epilegionaminate cytidylyltransferase